MNGLSRYKQKQARERLLAFYNEATETTKRDGLQWYNKANEFVKQQSKRFNVPIETVAKVLSALSPAVKWQTNKSDCQNMINTFVNGDSLQSVTVSTYGQNKSKAWNILKGKADLKPSALKTYAFYKNILLDDSFVTIDRWHLRASFKTELTSLTRLKYRQLEQITLDCAKEVGIKGYQFQAIVWSHIRTLNT